MKLATDFYAALRRGRTASVRRTLTWVLTAGCICGSPAFAHHSFAPYDMKVTHTAEATLKELDWSAPHARMSVVYIDKEGKEQQMYLATAAPIALVRQGFKRDDFKPGIKITVEWHPLRSGFPGGEVASIALPDGRVFHGGLTTGGPGGPGGPPQAPAPQPSPSSAP